MGLRRTAHRPPRPLPLLAAALLLLTGTVCWLPSGLRPAARAAPVPQEPGGDLMTRWAAEVEAGRVHPEYPRPQLVRSEWEQLNGMWDYALTPRGSGPPEVWEGTIRVPFPLESALSGAGRRLAPDETLWYRRSFEVPEEWRDRRLMLRFGAVDWESRVFVNGRGAGTHRGGYDAFSFDITDLLSPTGPQQLTVAVTDPTDTGTQPRGKQVMEPGGIWYTPSSGIWQTVWLEPVPEVRIERLRIEPDPEREVLRVRVVAAGEGARGAEVLLTAGSRGQEVGRVRGMPGEVLELPVPDAVLWSPETPFLYDLAAHLTLSGEETDRVESYFGMRSIRVGGGPEGAPRLLLNGEPLFHIGTLDQGYWPDGLYTAPTDEALRYDIEVTKALGFNTIRKHVKIEPDRWYWWCDVLGMMVWQDMPSGDGYIGGSDPDLERSGDSARQFERELTALVRGRSNHPGIVMWVPFNEGWGQYDTGRITRLLHDLDPTRPVDSASGWADRGTGEVLDIHRYPGPGAPPPEPQRALVLGEFGGLGLPLPGHLWQEDRNWGYRSFGDREALTAGYEELLGRLRQLQTASALSGAIYTQTTDVEIEVNGLMTYERAVIKMDPRRVAAANRRLHASPPRLETVVPDARQGAVWWRWTTDDPGPGWAEPDFDDSGWREGPAGFGRPDTPGAVVGTLWESEEIWLRRTFHLPDPLPGELRLMVHHDEDARIHLNGTLAARLEGYVTDYLPEEIGRAGLCALRPGRNTLAVHCRQTGGGQFIDVGIVRLLPPGP